ncbi:MAG: RNA polymerase sigma factor [Anaerolineae bacterium]|nr:RNA polymerase sigma factor [Anaerolineae bacterium]
MSCRVEGRMQTPTDEILMSEILQRDARAFEELFDRYVEALQRHVCAMLHDEVSAHDVVQETFLRVWLRAEQWDGRGTPKAWLYRIATNLTLNTLRTVQRRRELPLEIPAEPEDEDDMTGCMPAWMVDNSALGPEAAAELGEQYTFYRRALARLPEDKREVIHLVHELEMSLRDAADALAIPEGTVKSRLHYARRHLRMELEEE